ncbi:MAG: BMC domain-containing protein [Clostridia bacterium]|jgi:microcompartment protein CcmL/EutN|nr:BMC domain-containing protein [Clostridia bacterium]MBR0360022.1 BMC domain-containing protein [Clostridia bacterium]
MQALGLIETRSLTGAIDATDAMTKTADVKLIGTVKIGSGLVNVIVTGQVAAVRAAVAAGKAAAEAVGEVYATHVIPQPDDSVAKILPSFY